MTPTKTSNFGNYQPNKSSKISKILERNYQKKVVLYNAKVVPNEFKVASVKYENQT
jgi:hypothetical protein